MESHLQSSFGMNWDDEKFYSCPEGYFKDLLEAVRRAEQSIFLSFYIFEYDQVGQKLVEELLLSRKRGVQIRILVDGIGTGSWDTPVALRLKEQGIEIRVFHPLPWSFSNHFFHFLKRVNWRNHRKVAIFDEKTVFAGGINISDEELGWEDFAVQVSGEKVREIVEIFCQDWRNSAFLKNRELRQFKRLGERLEQIKYSQRVWMTTGYFVPPLRLLRALHMAAKKGSDVRLIVSDKSDWVALTWVSRIYFKDLIRRGVKVFIYPHKFIHGKCTLLDREAIVGSSNLNHRSHFLDAELDVVLNGKESLEQIERKLERLMEQSYLAEPKRFSFFKSLVARLLVLFKRWL